MSEETQTVWVNPGYRHGNDVYHKGEESCRSARTAKILQPREKDKAEDYGVEPCTYCYGEHTTENYDNSYQEALKREAGGDD